MYDETFLQSEQLIFNQLKSLFGMTFDDVTYPIRKDQFCLHLQTVCREDRTAIKSGRDYVPVKVHSHWTVIQYFEIEKENFPEAVVDKSQNSLEYPQRKAASSEKMLQHTKSRVAMAALL